MTGLQAVGLFLRAARGISLGGAPYVQTRRAPQPDQPCSPLRQTNKEGRRKVIRFLVGFGLTFVLLVLPILLKTNKASTRRSLSFSLFVSLNLSHAPIARWIEWTSQRRFNKFRNKKTGNNHTCSYRRLQATATLAHTIGSRSCGDCGVR